MPHPVNVIGRKDTLELFMIDWYTNYIHLNLSQHNVAFHNHATKT